MSTLLGNKKTQGDEQNWCIVLNPLRSELDKRRVARKISEVFSLSQEEASDLVINTPIILLDNLTRPIAAKVKEFFNSTGAEMILTNDVLLKRKCYRTVWPEPPNLSFLREWDKPKEVSEDHEVLAVDQALRAIRSMTPQDVPESQHEQTTDTPIPGLSSVERGQLLEEVDRWMKECLAAREEVGHLGRELEKIKKDLASARAVPPVNPLLEEREKEVRELRAFLTNTEEKYEGLLTEYREARKLFEDKMTVSAAEIEKWKAKIQALTADAQALQKEKQSLHHTLNETTDHYRQAKEEFQKNRIHFEEKLAVYAREVEQEKGRALEITDRIKMLQRVNEGLERTVHEKSEQLAVWSERHDSLSRKLDLAEAALAEEKGLRIRSEERQKDIEASQLRLIQELEVKTQESRELELKAQQFERGLQELREAYNNQEKLFEANRRHLETRERELESARRQLRDINLQMEQREVLQKRNQLASQLAESEVRLKILVRDQEVVESEIREREEKMKNILSQQEAVEKDIIENKQTQRHLHEQAKLEQAKKDRSSRVKTNRAEGEAPLLGESSADGS